MTNFINFQILFYLKILFFYHFNFLICFFQNLIFLKLFMISFFEKNCQILFYYNHLQKNILQVFIICLIHTSIFKSCRNRFIFYLFTCLLFFTIYTYIRYPKKEYLVKKYLLIVDFGKFQEIFFFVWKKLLLQFCQ